MCGAYSPRLDTDEVLLKDPRYLGVSPAIDTKVSHVFPEITGLRHIYHSENNGLRTPLKCVSRAACLCLLTNARSPLLLSVWRCETWIHMLTMLLIVLTMLSRCCRFGAQQVHQFLTSSPFISKTYVMPFVAFMLYLSSYDLTHLEYCYSYAQLRLHSCEQQVLASVTS